MLMAIGDIAFEAGRASYEELRRRAEYRWPGADRAGRPPVRQFAGPGEETIELTGALYPHFTGGLGRMDDLRDLAGRGEPQILVDGSGAVLGKWVIASVAETQTAFLANGRPRKIEFDLRLTAYGETETDP